MSIEPGTEITASKLLQEANKYYDEEGGIIPKPLRKEYYVALYDTNNKLMGRFIGQYMGIIENELTDTKYQILLLKYDQIIDYSEYTDEDNHITTLLFTNIRKAGKIGTGIRGFKPIDYEEGEFNKDVEERFYSERSILEGKIGVEFPLEFAKVHMKFYDYETGKKNINEGIANIVSSIITTKTGQNVRGIVDPNILNGGKTKRFFRKKRKCLTRKYKRKGCKKYKKYKTI
jgi:hypothetical protein